MTDNSKRDAEMRRQIEEGKKARQKIEKLSRHREMKRKIMQGVTAAITMLVVVYAMSNYASNILFDSVGEHGQSVVFVDCAKYDSLLREVEALSNLTIATGLMIQRDSSEVVSVLYVQRLEDSISNVSERVKLISDAISPQSVTEIITLQRLGDKYVQLLQTIEELKVDVKDAQSASDDALGKYAARIDKELDRFTPMIWGMLSVIVLIVIQNVWTQRSQKQELKQEETNA